jgi:exosome complex RNA-binding protein Rrp4
MNPEYKLKDDTFYLSEKDYYGQKESVTSSGVRLVDDNGNISLYDGDNLVTNIKSNTISIKKIEDDLTLEVKSSGGNTVSAGTGISISDESGLKVIGIDESYMSKFVGTKIQTNLVGQNGVLVHAKEDDSSKTVAELDNSYVIDQGEF